jgi:hypothetical protein
MDLFIDKDFKDINSGLEKPNPNAMMPQRFIVPKLQFTTMN